MRFLTLYQKLFVTLIVIFFIVLSFDSREVFIESCQIEELKHIETYPGYRGSGHAFLSEISYVVTIDGELEYFEKTNNQPAINFSGYYSSTDYPERNDSYQGYDETFVTETIMTIKTKNNDELETRSFSEENVNYLKCLLAKKDESPVTVTGFLFSDIIVHF